MKEEEERQMKEEEERRMKEEEERRIEEEQPMTKKERKKKKAKEMQNIPILKGFQRQLKKKNIFFCKKINRTFNHYMNLL